MITAAHKINPDMLKYKFSNLVCHWLFFIDQLFFPDTTINHPYVISGIANIGIFEWNAISFVTLFFMSLSQKLLG